MNNNKINGAQSLVKTLIDADVNICFTNPGTSEMHFVAALDKNPKMRSVLCLFEGGATGAADGYYRMLNKPASTLLHLGPGLANGLANLHNAKKAYSGIVNIVGQHTLNHLKLESPLTSDIEGIARPVSDWVKTSISSENISKDGAEAITIASNDPGKIATLILPADTAWGKAKDIITAEQALPREKLNKDNILNIAKILTNGNHSTLVLGGQALNESCIEFLLVYTF